MKFTNTIIALVLVGSLGGVLYYLNRHPASSTSTDTNPKKKLFSFQPDQVKEFTLETPDQPSITVRRAESEPTPVPSSGKTPAVGSEKGTNASTSSSATAASSSTTAQKQWEIVSPSGVVGDTSQIQSFVDGLPRIEYTPLEDKTPTSLAEYGLDQPKKTFKFQLAQGQPITLSIGKENPSGSAKYATLSSTPGLFLLDSIDTKDLTDKTLFDLRDKRVIPASLDKASQIQLRFDFSGKESAAELEKAKKQGLPIKPPKIVVTKQSNGNWELTDPAVRTDFGDTNYLFTTITGASMKSVEDENPKSLAAFGLDRPQIRLEVTTPDGVQTLLVGNKKVKKPETSEKKEDTEKKEGEKREEPKPEEVEGYFAKNSQWPTVFVINQSLYDQLNQDLDNYRNRYLFDFETSNARRVEIEGPQGELRFDRKGEDWFKAANTSTKVDASKVNGFLDAVHSLRIQHYTEDKPGRLASYGMDKPWMKVKVTFGEANKEETVLFGLKDKKFYAARQDAPSIYELSPSEPDNLQPKLKDLAS